MRKRITATDALFGFGAYLTTRKKEVTFSYKHNAADMVDLISEFLDANNLPDVSKAYPDNFVMPKG